MMAINDPGPRLSPLECSNTPEPPRAGWVELICGPMFSGKTEELIRRLRRAEFGRKTVQVFKPALDVRYDRTAVVSHSDRRLEAQPIAEAREMLEQATAEVIGIDEAQFFGPELPDVVEQLAERGHRVVLAGLDLDYEARPFEPVPAVMARAEYVTKLLAVCVGCGQPASRSQRVVEDSHQVRLGAGESYRPVCRACHRRPVRANGSSK